MSHLVLHKGFGRKTTDHFNLWLCDFKKKSPFFQPENILCIAYFNSHGKRLSPLEQDNALQRIWEIVDHYNSRCHRQEVSKFRIVGG